MWGYMVCVIVKATKFYASLESLGQSRPQLLEASLCSVNLCILFSKFSGILSREVVALKRAVC